MGKVVKSSFVLLSKFVLGDSEVLRNRHLRVAGKLHIVKKTSFPSKNQVSSFHTFVLSRANF
jgi:hypothetical protein